MRQRQPKTWFVPIALCALLVFVALQFSPRDINLGETDTRAGVSIAPETYIIGMSDRAYDTAGTLKHTLHAERVDYYQAEGQNRGDIIAPQLEFYSEGKAPWYLSAARGTADNQHQTLMLEQEVTAHSDHPKFGRVTISTDDLLIDTQRQYAHTSKPVTMLSARGKTTATGLNADLDEGQIELLAEVKSLYDPL
ncbi:LPS export ABC transporter periplasmic protein LptC [Gilvimarinus sp. DA14]|uniref:LPS export ABC transporter periplasmic protein LptC n=1 Tax=Gilvimarinus sp. DA14 TaxID=2956798 RepID=UPI0020B6F12C|nr:LPS export ABC transporter periplasmic protein LptC [Gilvimarinus sp. DA14]UTF59685.1 LPS export ABC transporter periplasmic protein LptC [Gilvimarinus sp. DA14]